MRQVRNDINVKIVHFSEESDQFRNDPVNPCEIPYSVSQARDYLSIAFLCRDTDGNEITFPFGYPSESTTTDDYPSGVDKNVIIESAVSKFRKFVTDCVNDIHLHDGTPDLFGSDDHWTENYLL